MYKISDEVINIIEKTMKTWRVELTEGKKRLSEVKIQRGIFQGDALSPLLFIIAMMPLNHLLRKCTVVKGDPKALFSIATTPRCRGQRYSIPWIAPLYPWSLPYNAEC